MSASRSHELQHWGAQTASAASLQRQSGSDLRLLAEADFAIPSRIRYDSVVSTAHEIEAAIRSLPGSERDKLLRHIPIIFPELSNGEECNAYGFSAAEMDKIGMKLHARATKRKTQRQSRTLISSIDESL